MKQNTPKTIDKKTHWIYKIYIYTLYTGLVTTAIGSLMVYFEIGHNNEFVLTTGIYLSIISSIAICSIIYSVWKFIIENKPESNRSVPVISAAKSVGYMFIPFYNLYWIFLSIGKMEEEVLSLSENSKDTETLSGIKGKNICYLILAGVVPVIGTVLALVANYVLLPKYLEKIIRIKNNIEITRRIQYKPSLHILNGVNNAINYKLSINLILASFIASFLHKIILNIGSMHNLNGLFDAIFFLILEILKVAPFYAMLALFFVFLLYFIKTLDILALSVGFLFSATSIPILNTGFHIHYLGMFIIGVTLIYTLNKFIKQYGIKFRSSFRSMLIVLGIAILSVCFHIKTGEKIFYAIFYSFVTLPVYSLAYFKGLKHISLS